MVTLKAFVGFTILLACMLVFVAAHGDDSSSVSPATRYDNCLDIPIDEHSKHRVYWSVYYNDRIMVRAEIDGASQGYGGVLFNQVNGSAMDANVVLGSNKMMIPVINRSIGEYYTNDKGEYSVSTTQHLSARFVDSMKMKHGDTMMDKLYIEFARPLSDATDGNYITIGDKMMQIGIVAAAEGTFDDQGLPKDAPSPKTANINLFDKVQACHDEPAGPGHIMYMTYGFRWDVMMFIEGWVPTTPLSFFGAAVTVFIMSLMLQILLYPMNKNFEPKNLPGRIGYWVFKSVLRLVTSFLTITQMLMMMSYNLGLIFCIMAAQLIGLWLHNLVFDPIIKKYILTNVDPKDYKKLGSTEEQKHINDDCCGDH